MFAIALFNLFSLVEQQMQHSWKDKKLQRMFHLEYSSAPVRIAGSQCQSWWPGQRARSPMITGFANQSFQ